MSLLCGCPDGRIISDPVLHDEWHALVVQQGGPDGLVNAETLQKARGFAFASIGEKSFDVKARAKGQRASGEQRRRAR